jgi:4'-phosphopantetheinyl transferase EntD
MSESSVGIVIDSIIHGQMAAVDTRVDLPPSVALLHQAERAYVARAMEARYREYVTARACARQAMTLLGLPEQALPPGPGGEPCWPSGVVGSITHCAGYRGAVVGRSAEIAAIGIDAEPNEPLPAGVLAAISLPQERTFVAELTATRPAVCWDRLLWCAKEAVYKAWYPLARRRLEFSAVQICVGVGRQTFSARLCERGPLVDGRVLTGFSGRWLVRDGLVLTAVVLPRAAPG